MSTVTLGTDDKFLLVIVGIFDWMITLPSNSRDATCLGGDVHSLECCFKIWNA